MGLSPMMYRRLLAEGKTDILNSVFKGEISIDDNGKISSIVKSAESASIAPTLNIRSNTNDLYTMEELGNLKSSEQVILLKKLEVKNIPKNAKERIILLFNLKAQKGWL